MCIFRVLQSHSYHQLFSVCTLHVHLQGNTVTFVPPVVFSVYTTCASSGSYSHIHTTSCFQCVHYMCIFRVIQSHSYHQFCLFVFFSVYTTCASSGPYSHIHTTSCFQCVHYMCIFRVIQSHSYHQLFSVCRLHVHLQGHTVTFIPPVVFSVYTTCASSGSYIHTTSCFQCVHYMCICRVLHSHSYHQLFF